MERLGVTLLLVCSMLAQGCIAAEPSAPTLELGERVVTDDGVGLFHFGRAVDETLSLCDQSEYTDEGIGAVSPFAMFHCVREFGLYMLGFDQQGLAQIRVRSGGVLMRTGVRARVGDTVERLTEVLPDLRFAGNADEGTLVAFSSDGVDFVMRLRNPIELGPELDPQTAAELRCITVEEIVVTRSGGG